jgi:calcineurin-like phosphoesterase family protein
MRKIFVISDTHFGHENILKFTDPDGALIRGDRFSSLKEMDECRVTNWNEVVGEQDIIYHLGDVFFGKGHSVLPLLKGRKRLILGNHDNGKSKYLQDAFQKVSMWRMFPEFNCVLTHVPILIPEKAKYAYNVHGHIHERKSPTDMHINVSCESIGYAPVDLEELAAITPR